MNLELHPLCSLFPRLDDAAFADLVADIRANGLREPITLHDGMILDGGNRYSACVDAGVEPQTVIYRGDNPALYVLSANLHRRHLSAGQRAAIVASVADFAKAHPAHRIAAAKKEGGNITPLSTRGGRANAAGVSDITQRTADRVAKADPVLVKQVAHGDLPLSKAAEAVGAAPRKNARKSTKRTETHEEGAPIETDADILQNLRAELNDAQAIIADLSAQLEAYQKASEGEHAVAKQIMHLNKLLEVANQTRDGYITTCGELRKEVAALQRKLKRTK